MLRAVGSLLFVIAFYWYLARSDGHGRGRARGRGRADVLTGKGIDELFNTLAQSLVKNYLATEKARAASMAGAGGTGGAGAGGKNSGVDLEQDEQNKNGKASQGGCCS